MPTVSIVMPVYNAEAFVAEAIDSVLAQTYDDWELLVCDDCSTDSSNRIIATYAERDPRIRLMRLDTNGGAAVARNTALRAARGRYIAFLDCDDLWKPSKLERQLAFMREHCYAFTFTQYETMSQDGQLHGRVLRMPERLSYKQYLANTAIGCLTVMVDRELTGDFAMPAIRTRQDMATWLLLLRRVDYAYALQENLSTYRHVSGSISSSKLKAAKQVWRVYRQVEGLGLLRSLYSFVGYAAHAVMKRL